MDSSITTDCLTCKYLSRHEGDYNCAHPCGRKTMEAVDGLPIYCEYHTVKIATVDCNYTLGK